MKICPELILSLRILLLASREFVFGQKKKKIKRENEKRKKKREETEKRDGRKGESRMKDTNASQSGRFRDVNFISVYAL